MPAGPKTVSEYLASVPEDRRTAINTVREVIRKNLDSGYEEMISYGMIGYCIPHSLYPAGYHCDPKQALPFAILGSKKGYMTLHLMCIYAGGQPDSDGAKLGEWFRTEWAKTGKKLDMGQACIHFKKVDDLALNVIAKTLKKVPSKKWMAINAKYAEARGKKNKK